jgi:phospholipase/carboxylesterase
MHGSEDEIVPPGALEMIKGRLHPERCKGFLFKNGHTIPLEMMQLLGDTLQTMLKSP